MYYDVIIIGAGPAGLKCAEALANSKYQVLLIEKNAIIGPKICAGGLTALSENYTFPQDKTLSFTEQIINLNGQEYKIKLKSPLLTINRYDLGQYQLKKIENCQNIIIKTKTAVIKIFNNHLITDNNETYSFRYLIGADGANSLVRRYLKLGSKIIIGLQYIIPQKYHQMIWFLNPKLIKSGYGWLFPHKEFTSTGIFYDPQLIDGPQAKNALNYFLDSYQINRQSARFETAPINYLYQGFHFNNIFLIGDAAGLTSKNTGEGIAHALISGEDVAKYLLNNNYNFFNIKKNLKFKKRQEYILAVFNYLPFMQTFLFKIFITLLRRPFFQKFYGN